MFRILVANSKGGCGKSTVVSSLAGHFARNGKRTTVLDCDPQGSSLAWAAQRPAHLPPVRALAGNNPAYGLNAGWLLRVPAGTEVLLVDTPAGVRPHEFEGLARHADALVIPVVPSPIDLRATLMFIDVVRKLADVRSGRLRVALIANRLRERANSTRQLDATLKRLTQAAKIRVRDSQAYVRVAESGRSIFDDTSSQTRSHREDWTALLQWLEARATDLTRPAGVSVLAPAAERLGSG